MMLPVSSLNQTPRILRNRSSGFLGLEIDMNMNLDIQRIVIMHKQQKTEAEVFSSRESMEAFTVGRKTVVPRVSFARVFAKNGEVIPEDLRIYLVRGGIVDVYLATYKGPDGEPVYRHGHYGARLGLHIDRPL